MKIDAITGHDSYLSWREGAHDDLVLAVVFAFTRGGIGCAGRFGGGVTALATVSATARVSALRRTVVSQSRNSMIASKCACINARRKAYQRELTERIPRYGHTATPLEQSRGVSMTHTTGRCINKGVC